MSTISVHLPDSLHRKAAEKISVLMTEDYLGERAKRGNRTKPHPIQPIEQPMNTGT